MSYQVSPVGFVRSCFKEKFAIPRQPQLAPAARGVLELVAPFDQGEAVQGLEQVSHVWLLFLFHQALEDKPRLKVRPPRLGAIPPWACLLPVQPIAPMASASRW